MGKGWLTCASTNWTTHLTLRMLFRGLCGIRQFLCSSFRVCASLSLPYKMKNPLPLGQDVISGGPHRTLSKEGSHCRSTHVVSFPPPGGQAHPEGCSHLPLRGRTVVSQCWCGVGAGGDNRSERSVSATQPRSLRSE